MKKFAIVLGIAFALICGFNVVKPNEVYADTVGIESVEEREAKFKEMLDRYYSEAVLEDGYSDAKVEMVHICENSPMWNGFIKVSAMKDGHRVWITSCGSTIMVYNYLLSLY